MIEESLKDCSHCESKDSLIRLLNKPYINKVNKSSETTGNITKQFIEENRKILEQQKKEIKEKTYDKS